MIEPFISIIIPVRNDASLLKNCLESILNLDYPKDKIEIIVADGMSTDNTVDTAKQHGARVVLNEKKTVSPGRNVAFKLAEGEIVAFTDADCIVDKGWIRNSLKYFEDDEVACVGGPNLTPSNEEDFGKAVGFVFNQGIFSAGSIHARELKEIRKVRSIPGCNAIYKKDALEKVMPIDESLITCDDTEVKRRLLDKGYKLLYTPDVFVWHYRRPNPKKLFIQMYRYAIGRLQVGKKDRRMINFVHILSGLSLPLSVVILFVSPLTFATLLFLFFLMLIGYSIKAVITTRSFRTALWVPAIIGIITVAWSSGFVRELVCPLKKSEGK